MQSLPADQHSTAAKQLQAAAEQPTVSRKKTKELTGKPKGTPLHSAARKGNLAAVTDILTGTGENELRALLQRQDQFGETALYIAAEYGHIEMVREMIKYYDLAIAGITAENGFDAFHIAAKQGDLEVLKLLLDAHPQLAMTVDFSNATSLHTAATQGHIDVVNFLLEAESSLATKAKYNGKTALHSASRSGHVAVVKALLASEPGIASRTDKKGQTALHMAVKGENVDMAEELIKADPSLVNMVDAKGNTPLHVATRKGGAQIVQLLLDNNGTDTSAVNKAGETALDTAVKTGQSSIAANLQQHGVVSARNIQPQPPNPARELKQTVSDIKHGVHNQLEHTRQTRKHVQGITKRLKKMHAEGLNNAINSTTVVAVLIATVAFAAIFTVPGQYVDDPSDIPPGQSLGEAKIAPKAAFIVFFTFDSISLFISLAVVVVQTSVVVIQSKAKTQMMAIVNKLMWLACVLVSIAFLALSFVVVGKKEKWLAVGVTMVGATIMVTTLGLMSYWVIRHRIEARNMRSIRKLSLASHSHSRSVSALTESEMLNNGYKTIYAI